MKIGISDCDRFVLRWPTGEGRGRMLEYTMSFLLKHGATLVDDTPVGHGEEYQGGEGEGHEKL